MTVFIVDIVIAGVSTSQSVLDAVSNEVGVDRYGRFVEDRSRALAVLAVLDGELFAMSVDASMPAWLVHAPLPAQIWTHVNLPWRLRVGSAIATVRRLESSARDRARECPSAPWPRAERL